MSESDHDNDVTQLQEELPDDRTERILELQRRSENRDLTDAEARVVEEDGKQILREMQPVMYNLSDLVSEITSELIDMFQWRNDDE